MRLPFVAALLLFPLAGTVCGQTSAEITGRIADASGAVIPGATVTALNTDRSISRATTSNDQGFFSLPNLDTGNYRITAEQPGFKATTHTGIKLDVNQSLRLDFTLDVGQVTEKVEVTGEVALVEANTAQLGTVVT
jgi:hypothetical protein